MENRPSSPDDTRSETVIDRPRVLVADDDHTVRELLQRALERDGLQVTLATNGVEALEAIARHDFAVVLLDVHMPVLDGLETLRRIRADDRSRTLPLMLLTAEGDLADRVHGLESGADDYLVKPFAIQEAVARVRAQIRGRVAWVHELDRSRERRRRLASLIAKLPRDTSLVAMAGAMVERLPDVLDLDGAAVVAFGDDGDVRSIASSGALQKAFPAGRALVRAVGRGVAGRAAAGPWLEAASGRQEPGAGSYDTAYVPFRHGTSPALVGCLIFALRSGSMSVPLSHRLPDLIDATEFIVAILQPAVELAHATQIAAARVERIIDRRQFAIYLQPIVRLRSGDVMASEALTRFADGTRPDVLFAEAALLGLDANLQRATVAAAIDTAASRPAGEALSVNLSADVIQRESSLADLIASARRPMIVEITEHERIDDYPAVRAAIRRLGPNVKLAIDDAGSGYASLRHILALKPAYVKLDIDWVHEIDRDPVRRALVAGLVSFAGETGSELIAEGIETESELKTLRDLGIQLGQGYLLGRPVPASA